MVKPRGPLLLILLIHLLYTDGLSSSRRPQSPTQEQLDALHAAAGPPGPFPNQTPDAPIHSAEWPHHTNEKHGHGHARRTHTHTPAPSNLRVGLKDLEKHYQVWDEMVRDMKVDPESDSFRVVHDTQQMVDEALEEQKAKVEQIQNDHKMAVETLLAGGGTNSNKRKDELQALQVKARASLEEAVAEAKETIRRKIEESQEKLQAEYGKHHQAIHQASQAQITRKDDNRLRGANDGASGMGGEQDTSPALSKDLFSSCAESPDNCLLFTHPPAPITAHPYCSCEARVQQNEIERTQYLDYHFNKFAQLRKCHGELCQDCVGILQMVFWDLTADEPHDVARFCHEAYAPHPDAHCEPFVKGFQLTAEGIKYTVAQSMVARMTKPHLIGPLDPKEDVLTKCAKEKKCLQKNVDIAILDACRAMDCCQG